MKTNHRTGNSPFVEAAQRAVRAVGWDPREDLEILSPAGSTDSSTVRYGYRASRIRLIDSPSLPRDVGALREMTSRAGLGKPSDLLEDVVASRVYMLYGGWDVCPYSADDYAEILEAVADGLRSAGMREPQVQEFVVPVTSFFVASVISGTYDEDWPIKAFQYGELLAPYVGANSQDRQPQDQQPLPPSQPRQNLRDQRPSLQAEQRRAAVSPPDRSLLGSLLRQNRSSADRLPDTPIDWGATRFNLHHEPILFQKMLPVTNDIPAGTDMGGFPDLLLVVDSSGSIHRQLEGLCLHYTQQTWGAGR